MRQRVRPSRPAALFAVLALWAVLPVTAAAVEQPPPEMSSSAPRPIVGGEPAEVSEYPWAVYLVDSSGQQFCGGALVDADKVLTAAHCAVDRRPAGLRVVAGRTHKNSQQGTTVGVGDVWVHPDYVTPYRGADVAVLALDRALSRSTAGLATPSDEDLYRENTRATVLGWGARFEGGQTAERLRRATVPVIADADCAATYGRNFVANAMVCAGYPEGGVDACQGDSGGPLVVGDKLIGLVSWGVGCARPGKPGVYTEVATYVDRIRARF
ncbi:Trypsin [Actinopolyspora xinjiangensis]|uniref:Trypsin n=1 Tax=Actinopolyspora xinjiangensis TaxID=405564 RepID=A0A1H0SY56_9ACTN|nr:serine protease [Actinopolyspora xinjiangensis]SDP46490.1 Trypsin [Actinopolyspora xinjiangensis]